MIPGPAEIKRSLTGAWWLFLGRPEGMRLLDVSIEGFWRSFATALMVFPGYLVIGLAAARLAPAESGLATPDGWRFVLAVAARVVLDFAAMPLVLALIARPLGVSRRYIPFIVASNWSSPIAVYLTTAAALVATFPGLAEVGSILTLAVFFLMLRYAYLVARIALEAPVVMAIGLVVLAYLLSLTVELTVASALGA